jgi:hypothetical protein
MIMKERRIEFFDPNERGSQKFPYSEETKEQLKHARKLYYQLFDVVRRKDSSHLVDIPPEKWSPSTLTVFVRLLERIEENHFDLISYLGYAVHWLSRRSREIYPSMLLRADLFSDYRKSLTMDDHGIRGAWSSQESTFETLYWEYSQYPGSKEMTTDQKREYVLLGHDGPLKPIFRFFMSRLFGYRYLCARTRRDALRDYIESPRQYDALFEEKNVSAKEFRDDLLSESGHDDET